MLSTDRLPIASAWVSTVDRAIQFITETRVHPKHLGRITFGYTRGKTFTPYVGEAVVYVPRWRRNRTEAA